MLLPDESPRYTDDELAVALPRPYDDYKPHEVFVISGHIVNEFNETPLDKRPRAVSTKTFKTKQAAKVWAERFYGHVYKDVSVEEFGLWAFVVPKPGA